MDFSSCRYESAFPFESEMLSEPFPAILESDGTRLTSESSVAPISRHTQGVHWFDHHSPFIDSNEKKVGHLATADGGIRQRSKGIRDFFRLATRTTSEDTDRKNATTSDRKSRNAGDLGHIHYSPAEYHAALQGLRINQLKESYRPRSQSDASSIPRRHHHASAPDAEMGQVGIESETSSSTRTSFESEAKSSRFLWDKVEMLIPGRSNRDKCEAVPPPYAGTPPSRSGKLREHCGTKGSKNGEHLNGLESTLNTLRVSGYPLMVNGDQVSHHSPQSPQAKLLHGHIGPEEFLEMYRSRAFSEPRPQARLEAVANVRMRRLQSSGIATSPVYAGFDSLKERRLILWRDKKDGTQLLVLPTDVAEDTGAESISLNESPELIYWNILKATKCYDIIPNSTKMVILDSQLIVKKALFALLNNGIRASPIWDSRTQQLSGMLTVTDFIQVLQKYYHCQPSCIESLEDHSISTFKGMTGPVCHYLVSIKPEESLLDAIFALRRNAIHRLPVIDPSTGNILYMLTYKRLLKFLKTVLRENGPTFINKTIEELQIGTFDKIATVQLDTTVIAALELLVKRGVSALPVIDSDRKLVSMYSRADVISMAAEKTYGKLDMTIGQARSGQQQMLNAGNIATCQRTDSLLAVVEKLAGWEIHRLPVLDVSGHVIGIVSVSDVLQYIADQESSLAESKAPTENYSTEVHTTENDAHYSTAF